MLPFPSQACQHQHLFLDVGPDGINLSVGEASAFFQALAIGFLNIRRELGIQKRIEQIAPNVISLRERYLMRSTERLQFIN